MKTLLRNCAAFNCCLLSLAPLAAPIQLSCLERDWFTVFARANYDVTSLEIAATDSYSGLNRLLIAFTEWDGKNERSSQLAYVDYLTCETLFFIKSPQTYEPKLFSLAIYSGGESEILYQVGKVQGEGSIAVTQIQNEIVKSLKFDYSLNSFLFYRNFELSDASLSTLEVLEPNVLLWTHPLGTALIDLNLKVVRALSFPTGQNLQIVKSWTTTTSNQYFVNVIFREKSNALKDSLNLKTFDLLAFSGVDTPPKKTQDKIFDLDFKIQGTIVAGTTEQSTALCFTDNQARLNLALLDASFSDNFLTATMPRSTSTNKFGNPPTFSFKGCAAVSVKAGSSNTQTVTAIVFTGDQLGGGQLVLLTVDLITGPTQPLTSSIQSLNFKLSNQKFQIFSDLQSYQFKPTSGFLAFNTRKYSEIETWGFILSTDELAGMRKTQLWENSNFGTTITVSLSKGKTNISSLSPTYAYVRLGAEAQTKLSHNYSSPITFNSWVNKLCTQPSPFTLRVKSYEITSSAPQEFSLSYSQIINTDIESGNSWFQTCFPVVNLEVEETQPNKFKLLPQAGETDKATIQVEIQADATVFARRKTLFGENQFFYKQVMYKLELQKSQMQSEFNVIGYQNDPPRITDPAPINNEIFISIQWAPKPPSNKPYYSSSPKRPLLEDVNGVNKSVLYESGIILDKEGDKVKFEMSQLSTVFKFELTKENRVKISMAQQMTAELTGLYKFSFRLTNNSDVKCVPNPYNVTIVIGLYPAIVVPETEIKPETNQTNVIQEVKEDFVLVPPSYQIQSTKDWFMRRSQDDRKAQLRIHPFSSDGILKMTFTKPVYMPEDALERIIQNQLVNITFAPSSYDYEEELGKTELKDWSFEEFSDYGLTIKIVFKNPNLLSYSIFNNDEVKITVNLTSIKDDGTTDELYGKYVKSVPLQYPESFEAEYFDMLAQAIKIAPYAIFTLVFICFFVLSATDSTDQTAIVWLIHGNLQLMVFLPLVNLPRPAQVNDLSKGFAKYARIDFIEIWEQSFTDVVAQYIFDFKAWSYSVPLHLEQFGFVSRNSFSTASGLNLLHCCLVIPFFLVLFIFGLCKCRFKRFIQPFERVRSVFFNNFYVRYNLETYMIYFLCYLLALQEIPSFYNWSTSLQGLLTCLHIAYLCCLPFVVFFFYSYNYANLVSDKIFRAKWGSLYMGFVENAESTKRTIAYKYPALILIRKAFFAVTVVTLHEYWIYQLGGVFLMTALNIYIVSMYSPYSSPWLNNLQLMHDVTMMILSDLMIAFNGSGIFTKDQNVRFIIGWVYVGFFAVSMAISLVVLVVFTLKTTYRTLNMRQQMSKEELMKLVKERRIVRLEKRKSISRRQTLIRGQNLKMFNNVLPDMSLEDTENPNTEVRNINYRTSIILQQQDENLKRVKFDQQRVGRALTLIHEGSSSDEESSNSVSSESSDLNNIDSNDSDQEDSHHMRTVEPSQFVMGLDLLPKLQRQVKLRPRSQTRLNKTDNLSTFKIQNNNRHKNTSPPMILNLSKTEKKRQVSSTQFNNSSDDGESSFKASSRLSKIQDSSVERKGHKTTKAIVLFDDRNHSFTNQMTNLPSSIKESNSRKKFQLISQENTDRNELLPSQISKRSEQSRHQREGSTSKRSSASRMSDIDDAISQKLEKIAKVKDAKRKATVMNDDSSQHSKGTSNSRRSAYVMGQKRTRDSLILEMAENIMVVSKVHESVITPQKIPPSKNRSMEFEFENDFNARNMTKQRLTADLRGQSNDKVKLVKINRLVKQANSMILQPGSSDLITSKMIKPLPIKEEYTSYLQESFTSQKKYSDSSSSLKSSKKQYISSGDEENPSLQPAEPSFDQQAKTLMQDDHQIQSRSQKLTFIRENSNIYIKPRPSSKRRTPTPIESLRESDDESEIASPPTPRARKGFQKPLDTSKQSNEKDQSKEIDKSAPLVKDQHIMQLKLFERKKTRSKSPAQTNSYEQKRSQDKSLKNLSSQIYDSRKSLKTPQIDKIPTLTEENQKIRALKSTKEQGKNLKKSNDIQAEILTSQKSKQEKGRIARQENRAGMKIALHEFLKKEEAGSAQDYSLSLSSSQSLKSLVLRENMIYDLEKKQKAFKQTELQKIKKKKSQSKPNLFPTLDADANPEFKSIGRLHFPAAAEADFASLGRRQSIQRKQSSKGSIEIPHLNLNSDTLLSGVRQKIAKKMLQTRKFSIISTISKTSAFTLEDESNENGSSPTNVKFSSMQ